MHVTRERVNGSKQLQLLSGVHYITYWISNYLFDMLTCFFNASMLVIALKIVDAIKNDSTNEIRPVVESLGYFYILLVISMFAWMTFAYFWSFFFSSDIICFVVVVIILGVLTFVDMIFAFLILLFQDGKSELQSSTRLINALRNIMTLLFPNILVKRGIYNIKIRTNDYCITELNEIILTDYELNTPIFGFKQPGLGLLILFSIIQVVFGFILIVLMEKKFFSSVKAFCCCRISSVSIYDSSAVDGSQLEEDVLAERNRIASADIQELSQKEPLVIKEVLKKFKKGNKDFLAVNNLNFGVSPNECFGLLGLNGAGKTTTFKIITGEMDADRGVAYINGSSIKKNVSKARRNLGFCPQFDMLPEYLTTGETFKLFSNIRGLNQKTISNILNDLTKVFKLEEFSDKLVQKLSGGNKRKVSSAIAFIGRPYVVILDEPTTGMDPAARRYLWTVIKKARDLGLTIVLTTHSMEESEALSTKLGIMVNGQFKCFGSVQHLKSKYGKGYTLIVKLKNAETSVSNSQVALAEEFVKNKINNAVLKGKMLFFFSFCF
jgi:ABC-type multidrug transport system ATPase subunit